MGRCRYYNSKFKDRRILNLQQCHKPTSDLYIMSYILCCHIATSKVLKTLFIRQMKKSCGGDKMSQDLMDKLVAMGAFTVYRFDFQDRYTINLTFHSTK